MTVHGHAPDDRMSSAWTPENNAAATADTSTHRCQNSALNVASCWRASPARGSCANAQTQFALPDYLLVAREREREERRRRLAIESGEGVGLVWIGAIAAVLALWFGGGSGIAAPVFVLGLIAIVFGFLRLRRDDRNMARVGTATVVVSSVVLGAALAQTLGFAGSQICPPPTNGRRRCRRRRLIPRRFRRESPENLAVDADVSGQRGKDRTKTLDPRRSSGRS